MPTCRSALKTLVATPWVLRAAGLYAQATRGLSPLKS
jgi:hypothetical protein